MSTTALYRTHDLVPPALTTNGGRTVMRRVCEEANISLDGDPDYLTPHGGRRGAGDVLYREDPVLAQTALRHRSIETTRDSYSYIEAGEIFDR
jgi:integrase